MTEYAILPSRRLRRTERSDARPRDAEWWNAMRELLHVISLLHGRRHVCVYDLAGGPGATDFDAFDTDGLEPCPTYTAAIAAADAILRMQP